MSQDKPAFNVAAATLLSPEELLAEYATLKQQPTTVGHAIAVTLPNAAVQMLESALIPHATQLSIAGTPDGILCAVLVIQAGPLQVQCIMPLLTSKARRWLNEGAKQRPGFLLAVDIVETRQLALIQTLYPLAGDPEGQWSTVESALRAPLPSRDGVTWVRDTQRLIQTLTRETTSLIPQFSLSETWYIVVMEPRLEIDDGSLAPPSGVNLH